MKVWLTLLISITLAGCLQTRSEVSEAEEKKMIQSQLQRNKADQEANLQNYEAQIRSLTGKIESMEFQILQLSNDRDATQRSLAQVDERFKRVEQALLQIEQGQVVALQPAPQNDESKANTKASLFDRAEALFAQKKWKDAVALYQKYRETNPKGTDFAAATLKIGMCFEEMKMKKEAKVFYEEVVERHPKSRAAKTAKSRIHQLKKK